MVRPPTFVLWQTYPYNLECITSVLEADGHEVHWVDAEILADREVSRREKRGAVGSLLGKLNIKKMVRQRLSTVCSIVDNPSNPLWETISDEILATRPDLIGISCYSASMSSTTNIVNHLRTRGLRTPVVLGGIHPTTVPAETLTRIPLADYVVVGEGETTIRELLRFLERGGDALAQVKGLAYRSNGVVRQTEPRALSNLEDLPPLNFSHAGFPYQSYVLLTSRGCPFNCGFCASKVIWTKRVRFRPPEHVVRDVVALRNKLRVKQIRFGDDTFTLNKQHMAGIAAGLAVAGVNDIEFSVGSRIDTIDIEKVKILKNMGVTDVSFGIESGSAAVLNRACKQINLNDVVPKVRMLNKEGIGTVTFFIVNHPDETVEDMKKTLSLTGDLQRFCPMNIIGLNTGFPYPGTLWWHFAEERGLCRDIDFYKLSHSYNHQVNPVLNMTSSSDEQLVAMRTLMDSAESKNNFKVRLKRAIKQLRQNPQLICDRVLKLVSS